MSQILLPPGADIDEISAVGPNAEPAPETVPVVLPLTVEWFPDEQRVQLRMNPAHFKTWGFVKHVLGMGIDQADAMGRQAQMADQMMRMKAAEEDAKLAEFVKHSVQQNGRPKR